METPQNKYNRTPKGKYVAHKASAKARGIPFKFTFEEWLQEWAGYLDVRGCASESYQMCRYGDTGSYEPGNVYMATLATNRADTRKLSDELVDYVRAAKDKTQRALSEELGVSASTINYVINRKGVYA